MHTDPNDHVATLKHTFTSFSRMENLVPLLVDALIVTALGACTFGILLPPLMLGYSAMCLRALRGQPISVGESFQGMQRFAASLVLGLLVFAATLVGGIALGVGALVASFCLSYVFMVQADRPELGAVAIATESFRLVRDHLVETGVLWLVGFVLGTVLSATVVGGVAVFAYCTLLTAVLYQRFTGR